MGVENMSNKAKYPELIVFAGPNGSGKTTITKLAKVIEPYINADEIKKTNHCTDIQAAELAVKLREDALREGRDFTFETVLSTERNLDLIARAKEKGYFVRCIYVLTSDVSVNISRVRSREKSGGHGVPEEKIRSRYKKALGLVPELVKLCDVMHIYDNTSEPFRIFKKRKDEYFFWENDEWNEERISELTSIKR
jgi:predicted ABC-type ATPase